MTGTTRLHAHSRVRLESPGDLIAAIPHLLGFHPIDSLVVVGLRGGETTTLGLTLRVDLPPPRLYRRAFEQLTVPLAEHDTTGVALVLIGPEDADLSDGLPHREMVAFCEKVFASAGIAVEHRLWAPSTSDGVWWRCYEGNDCGGPLPDPWTTPLAAATVAAGAVTFNRREDIAATLAPVPDKVLVRRAKLLEHASEQTEPGDHGSDRNASQRLSCVYNAIQSFAAGNTELTDEDVVRLAEALSDHRVRDACLDLGGAAGLQSAASDDGSQSILDAVAAERLWTTLVRGTPGPERAEAACLLAFSAHVRGDGVLAGIALERAEEADPGHRLTNLLRDALLVGITPDRLRAAGAQAAAYARQRLDKEKS